MFENYTATTADLKTIETALSFILRKELNFIFKDKSLLQKTLVLSYDSRFLYAWNFNNKLNNWQLQKIPHQIVIEDKYQRGWRCGLAPQEISQLLPQEWQADPFSLPKISGGLLQPFIELQKKGRPHNNPYITRESYLATIIHEFGHIYFNQHSQHWHPNKKQNLDYLKKAQKLYECSSVNLVKTKINIPSYYALSELFAFCTDYTAATIFWPKHRRDIDKSNSIRMKDLLVAEEKRDLNTQDSTLDENPHNFAMVLGKLLLTKHPYDWPEELIKGTGFVL